MRLPRSRSSSPRNASESFLKQNGWFFPWILFASGCLFGHIHGRYYAATSEPWTSSLTASLSSFCSPAPQDRDGWKSIQVFYGQKDFLIRDIPSNQTWYSQGSQDELIMALFQGKRNGYFIDLAANDAVMLSNTLALERFYDWNGLCIEPNPVYWHNLTFRDCQVVGAVVGQTRMEAVYFRFEAGDHGGIAGEGFNNGKRWQRSSQLKYTVTLLEILERVNAPLQIDYLSLDVEGAEAFIMMNFPLDRYKIKVITAERLKGPIRAYLKQHGYEFIQKLTRWGDSLWVHESIKNSLDMTALDRFHFPLG